MGSTYLSLHYHLALGTKNRDAVALRDPGLMAGIPSG